MCEPLIGEIQIFGGTYAPRGWAICDGTILNITQATALYGVIGNSFGGDGKTTFALPDLRDRTPIGAGTGTGLTQRPVGFKGGTDTVTIDQTTMPTHLHYVSHQEFNFGLKVATDKGDIHVPGNNNYIAASQEKEYNIDINWYSDSDQNLTPLGGVQGEGNSYVNPFGNNNAHENRQPSMALNFIIAVQGVFPQRS